MERHRRRRRRHERRIARRSAVEVDDTKAAFRSSTFVCRTVLDKPVPDLDLDFASRHVTFVREHSPPGEV